MSAPATPGRAWSKRPRKRFPDDVARSKIPGSRSKNEAFPPHVVSGRDPGSPKRERGISSRDVAIPRWRVGCLGSRPDLRRNDLCYCVAPSVVVSALRAPSWPMNVMAGRGGWQLLSRERSTSRSFTSPARVRASQAVESRRAWKLCGERATSRKGRNRGVGPWARRS